MNPTDTLLFTPETEAEARDQAITWQNWSSDQIMSWDELLDWSGYFEKVGARFGLTDEFYENGIL